MDGFDNGHLKPLLPVSEPNKRSLSAQPFDFLHNIDDVPLLLCNVFKWSLFVLLGYSHHSVLVAVIQPDTMFFTCLLLATLVYLITIFYWQRKRQMHIFKDLGIPGPEPNFLFGNLISFKDKMMCEQYQEWHATYGETFGYFEGPTPVLVTSNADMLQQVFVKQFNNFHARKLWPVQVDPDKSEEVHLFFARGQRWKRLRSVVNPAFTASKLRKLEPQMNLGADRLLEVLGQTAQESAENRVELCGLFRRLTLNVIVGCSLGLEEDAIRDPNNGFLKNCQGVIDDTTKQPVLYLCGFLFPTLNKVWMWLYKFMHNIKFNPVYWLEKKMKEYLEYRKNSAENYEDLLQQMLDARIPDTTFEHLDNICQSSDEKGMDLNGNARKSMLRTLTESEVVAHSLLFLLAGYETSSTTLAYIFYELATNPHVQDELRKEITQVLGQDQEPTYDSVRSLKYMDMVINETLRKYPLASTVVARQCQDTCQVGGLTIPSGMLVQANIWSLHKDPKHWGQDAHTFDPTRFSAENKASRNSMAWMPFGAGPRMCVGLRFAVVQMKITMCKLLRQYSFQPASDLRSPLQLKEGATILPKDGVPLRVVPMS